MATTLLQLLGGSHAVRDTAIHGLTVDSRTVSDGDLFVALPGFAVDGRDFIPDAIEKGAAAVLTTPLPDALKQIVGTLPIVEDANPRRLYANMAVRFAGEQPKTIVAVTGTNGKTSVADFTRQLWSSVGHASASVGTLGVRSDVFESPGGLTTPDPLTLYKALNTLATKGVDHVAVEASSHGLDQYRLEGLALKAAAFTNLTRDHLDYHRTEHAYFFAKARLFGEMMQPGSTAVVNLDDASGRVIDDIAWGRGLERLSFGHGDNATLRLVKCQPTATGQQVEFTFGGQSYECALNLVGGFQASNAMAAAGLVIASGVDPNAVFESLAILSGVPGRMELAGEAKGAGIFIDYAHTPDGLRTALGALRDHQPNALHVVFGCGGDRDIGKRPQMGSVAAELADHVYVTDDNPRTEDAANIRRQILEGCPNATAIGDRAEAIAAAIEAAGSGDMILVAGKGHETGQIIGDQVLPFSDFETVTSLLGKMPAGNRSRGET